MKLFRKLFAVILAAALVLPVLIIPCAAADDPGAVYIDEYAVIPEKTEKQLYLLAGELAAARGAVTPCRLVWGESYRAVAGDVLLASDENLQGDDFTVRTGRNGVIRVYAAGGSGFFHGLRYVIKRTLCGESPADVTVTFGAEERAMMLDIGRKYYTPGFIKELIRELSFLDYNTLVLHFSEEMGLGLESRKYPWLKGRDGELCTQAVVGSDNRWLKQSELRSIAAVADEYNVKLIPSFDSPGHMNYIVKKFNELSAQMTFSFTLDGKTYTVPKGTNIGNYYHYKGKTAIVQGSRNTKYSRGIDITNEIAVAFTKSLLGEYAELFASLGCDCIDIGGDELLGWGASIDSKVPKWQQLDNWKQAAIRATGDAKAVAYDYFLLYMNDLYDFVSAKGFTSVRMWNDDAYRSADTGWTGVVRLNENIGIEYWTPNANSEKNTPSTYSRHEIYNYLNHYSYYVLGKESPYAGANSAKIWSEWTPQVLSPGGGSKTAVSGFAFCVWCDKPTAQTEGEVLSSIFPMLIAMSGKAKKGESTAATYSAYVRTLPATYSAEFPPKSGLQDADPFVPRAQEITRPDSGFSAKAVISTITAFIARVLEYLRNSIPRGIA